MKEFLNRLFVYKGKLAAIVFLRAASSVASLMMPYIMSEIVNNGIAKTDMNYIYKSGAVMLLMSVIAMATAIITVYINTSITSDFTAGLQKDMFAKIMNMSFEEYQTIGTSSFITRCNEDVRTMEELVGQISYVFVSFPVLYIGGVILTMKKDIRTGLIMLFISPLILFIVSFITRKMGKLWENSDKYIDIQNKLVRERLSGLRVIRAFDKEDYEHGRIEFATKQMAHNIIKANVLSGVITPLCTMLLNVVTVIMLYTGAKNLKAGSMLAAGSAVTSAGDIIASVQYIALIANGLLILSWSLVFIPHIKVSLRRINEVFAVDKNTVQMNNFKDTALKHQEAEIVRNEPHEKLLGRIDIKNLTFSYSGAQTPALENINIHIEDGETVAIIGGTGSGKSTVAKLLMRFFDEYSGEIYIGDRAYSDISTESIRDNIACALQKSMIFEGTVGANIKLGKEDAKEEDMVKVCEIAQIYDFVKSHEEGFEYMLTQAGANISGGQKQRINIARTIIKPAEVYIFDDSFSALDYLTESNLRKALNAYLKGKTQLIITQRAATAMRCDRIYVMDNGRVVGDGTHKELLESCAIYKEIYKSQLGGGK